MRCERFTLLASPKGGGAARPLRMLRRSELPRLTLSLLVIYAVFFFFYAQLPSIAAPPPSKPCCDNCPRRATDARAGAGASAYWSSVVHPANGTPTAQLTEFAELYESFRTAPGARRLLAPTVSLPVASNPPASCSCDAGCSRDAIDAPVDGGGERCPPGPSRDGEGITAGAADDGVCIHLTSDQPDPLEVDTPIEDLPPQLIAIGPTNFNSDDELRQFFGWYVTFVHTFGFNMIREWITYPMVRAAPPPPSCAHPSSRAAPHARSTSGRRPTSPSGHARLPAPTTSCTSTSSSA